MDSRKKPRVEVDTTSMIRMEQTPSKRGDILLMLKKEGLADDVADAIESTSEHDSYLETSFAGKPQMLQSLIGQRKITLKAAEAAVRILYPEEYVAMTEKWGEFFKKFPQYGTITWVGKIEKASQMNSYRTALFAEKPQVLQVIVELTSKAAREAVKILHPNEKFPFDTAGGRGQQIIDGLDTKIAHTYDLDKFHERVESLFKWHKDSEEREKYLAPYFAVVQSSGMGKTKLLTEYKKQQKGIVVKTILCVDAGLTDEQQRLYFDDRMDIPVDGESGIVNTVESFLNRTIGKVVDKCVLLFDEAQGLMKGKDGSNNGNLVFRAIRWWLRMERTQHVVAVFAGTTAKLSNFFPADPPPAGPSRDTQKHYKNFIENESNSESTSLYPPFFQLYTISCLRKVQVKGTASVEPIFPDAAVYGRPLFAYYFFNGKLEQSEILRVIAQRLVLSHNDYPTSLSACYSVLGSRVQMGIVNSFETLSDLVSSGYACLVEFRQSHQKKILLLQE